MQRQTDSIAEGSVKVTIGVEQLRIDDAIA